MSSVTALIFLSTFLEAPLRVYLYNPRNFGTIGTQQVHSYGALVLVALGLVTLASWLWSRMAAVKQRPLLLVLLSGIFWLFWLQRNVLQWRYGTLDGSPIVWGRYWYFGAIDTAIWSGGLVLLVTCRTWFRRHLVKFNLFFIALSLTTIASDYVDYISRPRPATSRVLDYATLHQYSKSQNVIVIILDTFQSNVALEVIKSTPRFQAAFGDFEFFADSVAGASFTQASVPIVLTGKSFDNKGSFDGFYDPLYREHSLFSLFKERGFRIENYGEYFNYPVILDMLDNAADNQSFQDVPKLIDAVLVNSVPYFLKGFVYDNGTWLVADAAAVQTLLASVESRVGAPGYVPKPAVTASNGDRDLSFVEGLEQTGTTNDAQPVFKFLHLTGAHPPFHYNQDGKRIKIKSKAKAYRDTVIYKFDLMARMLDKLRALDAYDRSEILIMGDHGGGYDKGLMTFKSPVDGSAQVHTVNTARGNVLFMRKSTHSLGGFKVSDRPFHLGSVFDVLKNRDSKVELDPTQRPRQVRKFFSYWWKSDFTRGLSKYYEYLVVGHAWLADSWIPYHSHDEHRDKEQCLFNHGDLISVVSRTAFVQGAPSDFQMQIPASADAKGFVVLWRGTQARSVNERSSLVVELNGKRQPVVAMSDEVLQAYIGSSEGGQPFSLSVKVAPHAEMRELIVLQVDKEPNETAH